MSAVVLSVSASTTHSFSKSVADQIILLAGLGVEGDVHAGVKVRHRYRVRKNPNAPNLCQVHLLHGELFDELQAQGLLISAGQMGENITTRGIDLLGLCVGARLYLGDTAMVEVTGLREPCSQMNGLRPGLMKACLSRDAQGTMIRKAGIMGIVVLGGKVQAGHRIGLELPPGTPRKLGPV